MGVLCILQCAVFPFVNVLDATSASAVVIDDEKACSCSFVSSAQANI